MASHPAFLVVLAKIAQAKKAVAHMKLNNKHQKSLASTNPSLYSETVHAESMSTNVQGIYTHLESILKSIANTIDGFAPSGESSHRDLLLQVSISVENRPAIIQPATLSALTQLSRFRHAVRNNYAEDLRSAEVFAYVTLLENAAESFFADLQAFIASFEGDGGDGDATRHAKPLGASTQSDIIRTALVAYLQNDVEASTASCADRASRWVGMAQGPEDLSTNPEHLRGFGQ